MNTRTCLISLLSVAVIQWGAVPSPAADGSVKETAVVDGATNQPAWFKTKVVTDPISGKRANTPYVTLDAVIAALTLDPTNLMLDATFKSALAVPGATPSPSPAKAVAVQGAAGGITVTTNEGGNSKSHIATNTTTTAKSGAGVLHAITINTKGATANTATVYDNTAGSGTVIAVIDTTVTYGTLTYDVAFSTGLTIVTATGTAADITVAYR